MCNQFGEHHIQSPKTLAFGSGRYILDMHHVGIFKQHDSGQRLLAQAGHIQFDVAGETAGQQFYFSTTMHGLHPIFGFKIVVKYFPECGIILTFCHGDALSLSLAYAASAQLGKGNTVVQKDDRGHITPHQGGMAHLHYGIQIFFGSLRGINPG